MDLDGIVNPILCGRSLGQQFVVDQFAKSELSRLHYIKCNQKEMCAETYSCAKDIMRKSDGDGGLQNVGKRVILPSSFIGRDRYMHQEYLDSIGLYQCHGHPHGFATMTCNSNWHEIQENLKDGENPLDRPDLVACVFKLKKQQLIRDLGIEMLFGKMIGTMHSIEFQERRFPHMHIIFWLEEGNYMTAKELDQFICAELPDQYLSEKDSTGKAMMDGRGEPIYK